MSHVTGAEWLIEVARRIVRDLAEFSRPHDRTKSMVCPADDLLDEYDRRVVDPGLRAATRSRFVSNHYADAVEAGVKVLNELVRSRTGLADDGDSLMTAAFAPNAPLLRVNAGRTKSDKSEQRGHMHLCQGVVGAWRNPRAHSLMDDEPVRALMMLEMIDALIATTKTATRTRKRKSL